MLKTHAKLAQEMGMDPKHIIISDIGKVIELTRNCCQDLTGTVTCGQGALWTAAAWAMWAAWCCGTASHLAQDGMIVVVVMSMSGEDGSLVSGPDIITRGFVYVKESEGLMEELRQVALEAMESVRQPAIPPTGPPSRVRSRGTCPTTSIRRPSAPP